MPTIFPRLCRAALCSLVVGIGACSDNAISDPQLDPETSGENRAVASAANTVNITDLQVATGYEYVVATGLTDSARTYIDRPYIYDEVPRFLQGATYIQTRQSDRIATLDTLMTFRIDREAVVFLTLRSGSEPEWFSQAGFRFVRDHLYINKPTQLGRTRLYAKVFPAGQVALPPIGDSHYDMYTVIVRPVGDGVLSADAGGPYSAAARTMVQFVGTAETAPEFDLALTYTWDFGDGHSGIGPGPGHTYESPGNYTARLEVTDSMGHTVTATAKVDASSAPWYTVSQVSTGEGYACAVRANGYVNCWGQSDYGADPSTKTPSVGRFVQVAAHKDHACALRDDGAVECWGNNVDGRAPALRTARTGVYTQVGVGDFQSCALRDDGAVECWGYEGELWRYPLEKGAQRGYFTQLAFGNRHICALRIDGAVECWGLYKSTRKPASGKFVQVTAGENHTCALRDDGGVECWYLNQFGQAPPTRSASTGSFVAVEAGAWHTCGLRSDGVAECWGGNGWGQAPATRTAFAGKYRQLSGGYYFTCAVRTDDAFECWGKHRENQALSEQRIVPTLLPPDTGYVGASYPMAAEGGGSPSPVRFRSQTRDVCRLSEGPTVSAIAPGICRIRLDQAGTWRYFGAPRVDVSFRVEVP